MNNTFVALVLASLSFASHSAQTEKVKVNWHEPDEYTDIRAANSGKKSFRRSLFAQMDKHWQKVANKHLPEGVALDVKVTNVNLAGDVRYNFQMGQSIRLVKTIYWPSIEFEYTLREGNKVIKTDTIKLKDMAFMDRGGSLTRSSTPYFYEKRLITDWFKKDVKAMLTQWQKYNTAEMT